MVSWKIFGRKREKSKSDHFSLWPESGSIQCWAVVVITQIVRKKTGWCRWVGRRKVDKMWYLPNLVSPKLYRMLNDC